jgi:hypothetical protein
MEIEIHSGILKHLLPDLLSCYERDEAPGRAFGTSPAYTCLLRTTMLTRR